MPNQNRTPGQRAYNAEAQRQANAENADRTKHVAPHRIVQGGVEVSPEDVAHPPTGDDGSARHPAPSAPRTMDIPARRDPLPQTPSGDDVPGPTAPGYGGQRVPVGPLPASPVVAPAAPVVQPGDTRKTTRR